MPDLNYNLRTLPEPATMLKDEENMISAFRDQVSQKMFPCVAARAALGLGHIEFLVATHIACPADDEAIITFVYDFVDRLRNEPAKFRSAVILFRDSTPMPEVLFDRFMWNRLQALTEIDRLRYSHDPRVSSDPASPDFSFSLKEEAFYIIGMHAESSRPARKFNYPALVFNPHAQFEALRAEGKYGPIQQAIRKRDLQFSGSLNPMLSDFGESSETFQYSGMRHESGWTCPLKIKDRE